MKYISLDGQKVTPSKIVCIGWNYVEHIKELDNEVPEEPTIFIKPNSSISDDIYFRNRGQRAHRSLKRIVMHFLNSRCLFWSHFPLIFEAAYIRNNSSLTLINFISSTTKGVLTGENIKVKKWSEPFLSFVNWTFPLQGTPRHTTALFISKERYRQLG